MKKETPPLSLEEEFILADIFTPFLALDAAALSDQLDRLQKRRPYIPEVALLALVQIRMGMAQLLERIPPEKHHEKTRLKLLRAAFLMVMKNKVSGVLKDINRAASLPTFSSKK